MPISEHLSEPKLLLSKYLHMSGDKTLLKSEPYSAGLAVSLYQDAVESLIWSVAKEVDAKISKKTSFEEYWTFVESAPKKPEGSSGLPLKAKMLDLNQARVAFKHYGTIPAYTEAERFSAYAAEFLQETAYLFFGVDFRNLSMASLIRNDAVRQAIKDAEILLSDSRIEECLNATAAAEYVITRQFEDFIPSVDHRLEDLADLAPHGSATHIRSGLRYIREYLSTLRQWQLQAFAGRDFAEYPHFQRIAPHAHKTMNGAFIYQRGPRHTSNPTISDAEFCIRYVTDYAIQAQNRT